jgi:hypothetical protein
MTAADIQDLIEHHAGDPEKAARALVDAANEAGGKDNVTVILVETEGYAKVSDATGSAENSGRHSSRWTSRGAWFLLGFLAASAVLVAARPYWEGSASGLKLRFGVARPPRTWTVNPDAVPTIGAALELARPGDSIEVSAGEYHEEVHLRSGISVVSTTLHGARIFSPDVAVFAENIQNARFAGFDIAGSGKVGIRIADSDLRVTDVRVSGMQNAGIEITGKGESVISVIRASEIIDNPGAGVSVRENARPRLEHNLIRHNGYGLALRPGILIEGSAAPTLFANIIEENAAEQILGPPTYHAGSMLTDNVVAPGARENTHQLKVKTQ